MSSRHPRDPWIDYTGGVAQRTPVSARSERRAEASNQLGGWRRPENQTPQLELGGGGLAQPNAESTRWPTDPSSWGCGLGKRAKRYAQADCNCALVIGRCVRYWHSAWRRWCPIISCFQWPTHRGCHSISANRRPSRCHDRDGGLLQPSC